ncbi:co-chaperone HscB [Shewanella sp. A3A]|uniref:Co-chaperone protein HscB homolog n=1 Tax=Shewanella electrica TaxID=515560 RepID=A0ABT2FMG8_9GAMM|nr:co-chaperone HscB [Shewanella electrica]MCH1919790.1 co-chaperone HscB [Shewanella ferrihydritica]MCH1924738.1 co-chaperone HscB [Shewanella electrica]MCS4556815.1 co-chaperone HscB [Shewanella electrica]
MNYFELFDLPATFDVDVADLSTRYRELQKATHPDRFANASEQQKMLAVSRTAQINDGFQTLKEPIRRAEHLLELKGVDIKNETQTVKDTSFLMQQMEWREALEDISHSRDADAADELEQTFKQYRAAITEQLQHLLASDDASVIQNAADHVRKLKFMAKLQDELVRIQDALFE